MQGLFRAKTEQEKICQLRLLANCADRSCNTKCPDYLILFALAVRVSGLYAKVKEMGNTGFNGLVHAESITCNGTVSFRIDKSSVETQPFTVAIRFNATAIMRYIINLDKAARSIVVPIMLNSALHLACRVGKKASVCTLLDEGADPNNCCSVDMFPNHMPTGRPLHPLEVAQITGHGDIAELLRERGAILPTETTVFSLLGRSLVATSQREARVLS